MNKRNWVMMAVVFGLTVLWLNFALPFFYKKFGWSEKPPAATQPADTTAASATTGPSTTGATATSGPATGPAKVLVKSGAEHRLITLGEVNWDPDGHKPYPLGLELNTRGAAIQSATLNRFRAEVSGTSPYVFQKPYDERSPLAAALATRSVSINGGPARRLDDLDWQVDGTPTDKSVTFFADVVGDVSGQPLLRVTKTYELRDAKDKTAGYEVPVTCGLKNLSDQPLKARVTYNGTIGPRPENNRDVPEVIAAFDAGGTSLSVQHVPVGSVKHDSPPDLKKMYAGPMLWSGMTSAYFNALVRPTDASGNPLQPAQAQATVLNPVADASLHDVALGYETADLDVPAGGSTSFALNVYLGPKARDIIEKDYYTAFPLRYDETLVLKTTSGIGALCGLCTWSWLISVLVWLLQKFHLVLRDWGLAIIALVLLVRLILHPVTKRSQVSMSKMTKMGPEMERLKNKYKDDPEALKKAQVDFYREQGIAPFLGCLPMFLQMPIWIALWASLQSTFEIRHAPFLWNYTWIKDLAQPDRLIKFGTPITLLFFHVDAINILPIVMGIVSGINQMLQPQPVAMNDQQKQQQQMMKWMTFIMFPLIFYTSPSGLNLYIFTSTLIGIFESKRIRDHIKEQEEREKTGVVIVDAPPGGGGVSKRDELAGGGARRAKTTPSQQQPEKPVGGIAGFFAKLQQMADEAKREQERRAKKGGGGAKR